MKTASSQKMGEMPIPKLLAVMSAPAIISMLVQALYNVVDSVFVARVSIDALTALSIAFPMQMLVLAFSMGVGIGTGSIVSRKLGQANPEEASKIAKNGLIMTLVLSAFWLAFGYLISVLFAGMFADKGSAIYTYTKQYLFICVTFSAGSIIEIFFNKLNQAMGNMIVPMITQLIGAIVNIILDPILIFGLIGFPALGVRGAAIATVIGQTAAMLYAVIMFFRKKQEINFSFKGFRPEWSFIKAIILLGLPITVLNSISSFATTAMNGILISMSATAVAVLGVYFKLQSFVFMPVFGLNQGALPIEAYNYGANNKKRFMHTYLISLGVALSFLFIGICLFHGIPRELLSLFDKEGALDTIGVHALRVISLSFIPAAFGIVTINMFQALGRGFTSMVMSVLRQLGFLLPISLIFAKTAGLDLVWWAYPISEILVLMIFSPVAAKTIKKAFDRMKKPPIEVETTLINVAD